MRRPGPVTSPIEEEPTSAPSVEEDSVNRIWMNYYEQVKSEIRGSPSQKDVILRKRLLKFFNNSTLESDRFFVDRREVNRSIIPVFQASNNILLLYGVDFLSEKKVERYFEGFETIVDFYDDSHCQVKFDNFISAYEALSKLRKEDAHLAAINELRLSPIQRVKWVELQPYYQFCFERRLWARFVTNQDVKEKKQSKTSLHSAYLKAKTNFFEQISKQYTMEKGRTPSNLSNSRNSSSSRSRSRQSGHYYQCNGSRSRQRSRSPSGLSHRQTARMCRYHFRYDEDPYSKCRECKIDQKRYQTRAYNRGRSPRSNARDHGRREDLHRRQERRTMRDSDDEFERYRREGQSSLKAKQNQSTNKSMQPLANIIHINESNFVDDEVKGLLRTLDSHKFDEAQDIDQFEHQMKKLKINANEYSAFQLDQSF